MAEIDGPSYVPTEADEVWSARIGKDWNVYEQIAKRSLEAKDAAFFCGLVLGCIVGITVCIIVLAFMG